MSKHQHLTFSPNAVDKWVRGEINRTATQSASCTDWKSMFVFCRILSRNPSSCLRLKSLPRRYDDQTIKCPLQPADLTLGPCIAGGAGPFFVDFFGPINAADIIWQIQTSPVGWQQVLAEIQALYSIIRASRSLEYDQRTNTALQHWADDQVFSPLGTIYRTHFLLWRVQEVVILSRYDHFLLSSFISNIRSWIHVILQGSWMGEVSHLNSHRSTLKVSNPNCSVVSWNTTGPIKALWRERGRSFVRGLSCDTNQPSSYQLAPLVVKKSVWAVLNVTDRSRYVQSASNNSESPPPFQKMSMSSFQNGQMKKKIPGFLNFSIWGVSLHINLICLVPPIAQTNRKPHTVTDWLHWQWRSDQICPITLGVILEGTPLSKCFLRALFPQEHLKYTPWISVTVHLACQVIFHRRSIRF